MSKYDVAVKNTLGNSKCMDIKYAKDEIKSLKKFLKRDKLILKELKEIRTSCSYELGLALDSAIGRITFEVQNNKKRIKQIKKDIKNFKKGK